MTFLRLLNPQGIAGLAASIVLALLLVAAKVDARHWRKQSAQFEQLYRAEVQAHASSLANVRAAAERARAEDRANADRVRSAQQQISERIENDFEARLADARARARRLQPVPAAAGSDGAGRAAPVPGLSAAPGGPAQAAGEDGLSDRLTATEQAIQLDELIKWVKRQAAVEVNAAK